MVLLATLIIIHGAGLVGSMPQVGTPENITVMFLSPTSVRVSWTTSIEQVEKYDVTYKPTDASYRVVAVVAGNSDSVTLSGLLADTQYQVTVTAVRSGKKYKSRPIVFRTLELPRTHEVQITQPGVRNGGGGRTGVPPSPNMPPTYIQVRGVEVGIVLLVLLVWIGAIILFFNRWGKIRMLLPYQPDYKDTQLKVPGTGACAAASSCQNQGNSTFCCSQRHLHRCGLDDRILDWRPRSGFFIPSRSRINSAIYISSQSHSEREPLCDDDFKHSSHIRKAKSADNLRTSCMYKQDSDPTSSTPGPVTANNNNFELPILSVSVATEKPFVEHYL